MRVNVYEEELTDKVAVTRNKRGFIGVCFFLELPATVDGKEYRGPFMHGPDDNDSGGVTLFARDKQKLRNLLTNALARLDAFPG